MLSAKDIEEKQFSKQLKGYNVDEVDVFLDDIVEDYEKLIKTNKELEEKIEVLTQAMEEYKAIEGTLQDTLLMAQKTAGDVKNVAKKEAAHIIESAKDVAKKTMENINTEIEKKEKEFIVLKNSFKVLKEKMESLLISELELLSETEEDEDFAFLNEEKEMKNNEIDEEEIEKQQVEKAQNELEEKIKELKLKTNLENLDLDKKNKTNEEKEELKKIIESEDLFDDKIEEHDEDTDEENKWKSKLDDDRKKVIDEFFKNHDK